MSHVASKSEDIHGDFFGVKNSESVEGRNLRNQNVKGFDLPKILEGEENEEKKWEKTG